MLCECFFEIDDDDVVVVDGAVDVDFDGLVLADAIDGVAMADFVVEDVVVVEVTGFRRFFTFERLTGDDALTASFERAEDLIISFVSSVSIENKIQ